MLWGNQCEKKKRLIKTTWRNTVDKDPASDGLDLEGAQKLVHDKYKWRGWTA